MSYSLLIVICIDSTNLETIEQEAILAYPLECCGLLLGKIDREHKQITKVVPTKNDWENQKYLFMESNLKLELDDRKCRDSFSINPLTFLKIQKQARQDNLDIVGIYHSHPNHSAKPSAFDTQFAWSIYSYMILSINEAKVGEIQCWVLDENRQFGEETIVIKNSD